MVIKRINVTSEVKSKPAEKKTENKPKPIGITEKKTENKPKRLGVATGVAPKPVQASSAQPTAVAIDVNKIDEKKVKPKKEKPSKKVTSVTIRENSKRDLRPQWSGHEEWTGLEFTRRFHDACQFYNLTYNAKQLKPNVLEWMKLNGYSKDEVSKFRTTQDWRCNSTMGLIASCLLRGMPAQRDDFNNGRSSEDWLRTSIADVLARGSSDVDEEAETDVPAPTIQERVRDIAMTMVVDIDSAIESFYENPEGFNPKSLNILSTLKGRQVKAAHARYIKQFYESELNEYESLLSADVDSQLKEGYARLSKKQIRNFVSFLKEIQSACDMLLTEAKTTRKSKKPKEKSKEKIVSGLKYKKTEDSLKLVSIRPTDIIGAKELWVYNTKTRKLGKYMALGDSTLTVKGTSINNFDPSTSIQKTLRQPKDGLNAFLNTNKVGLRTFMDTINSVSTFLTGRINEDIILLKITG